jgi:serine/threonine protein kinase
MPYINGHDFEQHWISRGKRFTPEEILFYTTQIVLALGGLHKLGAIHRDLKFENLLINEDGNLVLIDYGLAAFFNPKKKKKKPTENVGNPIHKAPEVYHQRGHDKSADWWSLGIMIFEMVEGVSPFDKNERAASEREI